MQKYRMFEDNPPKTTRRVKLMRDVLISDPERGMKRWRGMFLVGVPVAALVGFIVGWLAAIGSFYGT